MSNVVNKETHTVTLKRPATPLSEEDQIIFEQVETAFRAGEEKKALNPVVLRLSAITEFTDFFYISTGTNPKQVQAIADSVVEELKKIKLRPLHTEGYNNAEWILIDYGTFIVHVFTESARSFYDLERLWRDAERLDP